MSSSTRELAKQTDPLLSRLRGSIRRMAVRATGKVLWQLSGYRLLDGQQEVAAIEVFPGIGIYARPPKGSKAEAIAVNIGGANSQAIVATRDEKTRAAVAAISDDETAIFNSKAIVVVKSDGTVEIRSANGTAVPLALKSDVQSLRTTFIAHTHTGTSVSGGAVTTIPTTSVLGVIVGTSKLKGE